MKKFSVNLLKVGMLLIIGLLISLFIYHVNANSYVPSVSIDACVNEKDSTIINEFILRNSILPAIAKNPNKLESKDDIDLKITKVSNPFSKDYIKAAISNNQIKLTAKLAPISAPEIKVNVQFEYEINKKYSNKFYLKESVLDENNSILPGNIDITIIPCPVLSFLPEGATSGVPESIKAKVGSKVQIPDTTPIKNGYKFQHYATDSQIYRYNPGDYYTLTEDTTMFPVWKADSSSQNNTNSTPNTTANSSSSTSSTSTNSNTNETQYTVKFNANGGTGSMSNQTITHGTKTALTKNVFKKDGYTFKGWYAERSKDGYWYFGNDQWKEGSLASSGLYLYKDEQKVSKTVAPGASVTMYAVWTKIEGTNNEPTVNTNTNTDSGFNIGNIEGNNIIAMILNVIMQVVEYVINNIVPFITNTVAPAVSGLITSISSQ